MADAKNTVLFPYETLKKLSMDAFQKFGFSEKEADIIQDVLLTSDLFGIQSHGMQRMVRYHKGITNGLIKIDAKPEIVKDLGRCNVYTKPDCKDCFARFYCSGGCAANGYHFGGDIRGNYKIGCELQRKRVECAIMIKAALAE